MNCPKCGSEMALTTWVGIYPRDGWWCNNCKFHKIARTRYWDDWPWSSIPGITGISEFFGHEEKVGGEKSVH